MADSVRGVTAQAMPSEGGDATIVQIDTAPDTGRVWIYLNDGLLFEGDPEVDSVRLIESRWE